MTALKTFTRLIGHHNVTWVWFRMGYSAVDTITKVVHSIP